MVQPVPVGAGHRLLVRIDAALIRLRTELEVLGLLHGLDEGGVHVVQLVVGGPGASLGDVPVQGPTDDLFAHPDAVDELVDIYARIDAHIIHHVEDIFAGRLAGCPPGAAVGAASEAADASVDIQGVFLLQHPKGSVCGGKGHVAPVVEVHAEVLDLGPALLYPDDALLDLVGAAPAHRVAHAYAFHLDVRLVPKLVLLLQHGHEGIYREVPQEVGTPAGVGADACRFHIALLGLGHDLGPAFHLLHLGAVGVPANEDVAHVALEPGVPVPLDGQGRRILLGSLDAPGIQRQGGVLDPFPGMELGHDLVDAGHLGGPLGAYEGAYDDVFQPRFREGVQ